MFFLLLLGKKISWIIKLQYKKCEERRDEHIQQRRKQKYNLNDEL